MAHAHQERMLRQQERDRLLAARKLQRVWRGYRSRESLKESWRRQWDASLEDEGQGSLLFKMRRHTRLEENGQQEDGPALSHDSRYWDQMRLLLRFLDVSREDDLRRLDAWAAQMLEAEQQRRLPTTSPGWELPLLRLAKRVLDALATGTHPTQHTRPNLSLLRLLARSVPERIASISTCYYQVLSSFTRTYRGDGPLEEDDASLLLECLLAPLQAINPRTLDAYEAFIWNFLTMPDLERKLRGLKKMSSRLNLRVLNVAIARQSRDPASSEQLRLRDKDQILWLLAHVIRLHRELDGIENEQGHAPLLVTDYLNILATLMPLVATDIADRLDPGRADDSEGQEDLPGPVAAELGTLASQRSIVALAAQSRTRLPTIGEVYLGGLEDEEDDFSVLATYLLSLIRAFPRRSDDIRMWLYLGAGTAPPDSRTKAAAAPTVRHFWEATRYSEVVEMISKSPRHAIDLVKIKVPTSSSSENERASNIVALTRMREWRLVLVFLELYGFVLKVIDDDEFFSENDMVRIVQRPTGSAGSKRASPLPLNHVREVVKFLVNLGFALCYYASEMDGTTERERADGLRQYIKGALSSVLLPGKVKPADTWVAGIHGMTTSDLKGTVTGLLRMLYERDSRRQFVPPDQWLMTQYLDMDTFILTVVEEEKRRTLQSEESDDEAATPTSPGSVDAPAAVDGVRDTDQSRRTRTAQAVQSNRQQQVRKRYLEVIAPRLEILENMPFFIPFSTRVRIFREFTSLSKFKVSEANRERDRESWRMGLFRGPMLGVSQDGLSRHHADIRRGHVFDDAFKEFYGTGADLKETIHIGFVDQWGHAEAGVDGGGVTKEFLTSVTSEAFAATEGVPLFVENDKHLLYPNPSALDEVRLGRGPKPTELGQTPAEREKAYLQRYEFLGRIIGKCLYEGILVDIGFAGFFLLKWALTGGSRAAAKESGYRPSLNDVKDLDESLYQGLLQLKNHGGDVSELGLDFSITDTIGEVGDGFGPVQTITRELKPGGSRTAVTNSNRLIYISYVARHKLQTRQRAQTDAFLLGLGSIIQPSWLSMFNRAELQTLVSGDASEIDVADLRRNTSYGGLYVIGDDGLEHPTVQLFWDVMNSISDADRRNVVKFVTSTPRAPLLGFDQLKPTFTIRDSGTDEDRLPSTSTCVNLLKLPRYTTADTLREKLLYAVRSGAGFDLS